MSEASYLEDMYSGEEINDPHSIWYIPHSQTRESKARKAVVPKNKKGMTGRYKMKCHCGSEYEAKGADLGRGWGFSCSKRCSAIRREFGKPKAQIISKIYAPTSMPTAKKQQSTELIIMDKDTGEVIEINKY